MIKRTSNRTTKEQIVTIRKRVFEDDRLRIIITNDPDVAKPITIKPRDAYDDPLVLDRKEAEWLINNLDMMLALNK